MVSNRPKQRILIIDDTAASINMLGTSLSHDYKVYIATNGNDALQRAEEVLPDLILLDIVMPGMDGYEVCRRLKEKRKTRSIPIIFISSKASWDDESQGLAQGAVDYIRKPFNLPIVKSRVHTHLSLQQARENAETLVAERTAELLLTQEQLEKKTKNLEETNTALEVLLRRRDHEKVELETEIMNNVNKLVRPYLEKLEPVINVEKYKIILQAAIVNLNEIIDPFTRGHLANIARLTPAEIQVANFIKMGKTSKEIASFLGLSIRTVEVHRGRIRKKLGLHKRTASLRKHLLSHL
jgi:DNA-binding response OmpR family regulator